MKIISSTVKRYMVIEEEVIIDCGGNMVDFRDTIKEMKSKGYLHDFIIIDELRYERFIKHTEEPMK